MFVFDVTSGLPNYPLFGLFPVVREGSYWGTWSQTLEGGDLVYLVSVEFLTTDVLSDSRKSVQIPSETHFPTNWIALFEKCCLSLFESEIGGQPVVWWSRWLDPTRPAIWFESRTLWETQQILVHAWPWPPKQREVEEKGTAMWPFPKVGVSFLNFSLFLSFQPSAHTL